MNAQPLEIFIVAGNALVVNGLRRQLSDAFGEALAISCFYDSRSCLGAVKESTRLLVLDYFIEGKRGLNVLKAARIINPELQGIMHSSTEDVISAVNAALKGEALVSGLEKKYSHKLERQFI